MLNINNIFIDYRQFIYWHSIKNPGDGFEMPARPRKGMRKRVFEARMLRFVHDRGELGPRLDRSVEAAGWSVTLLRRAEDLRVVGAFKVAGCGTELRLMLPCIYINVSGTFYYLCSILDGCSRYIVNWDLRESMTEADIEIVLERAKELHPTAKPRIISDNGPQFIAKDFKEFIRVSGMATSELRPTIPNQTEKSNVSTNR